MKKIYIAPEMEILDAEIEGFLASSRDPHEENGGDHTDARLYGGGGFDDFDDFEEDDY